MMIWDVLGREGYTATHSRTFAGVHGAILVADLTRKETLTTLERYWIPMLYKVTANVPLVFACNKSDLEGESTFGTSEIEEVASRYNIDLKEELPGDMLTSLSTSAKTGKNVEKVFESLGHLVLSDKIPGDPIKEFYESLVAEGISRRADRTTLIGAADALILDFCETIGDDEIAMSILRQEVLRAGVDVRNPSKEGLLRAVEYLAEAEADFKNEETAIANRERRLDWVRHVKE
jgi:hypothetical protein